LLHAISVLLGWWRGGTSKRVDEKGGELECVVLIVWF